MKKKLPAYARNVPTAMASSSPDASCEHCGSRLDVWEYYYDAKHDLCRPCAILFGAGTRWEYAGGGSIRVIERGLKS